MNDQVDHRHRRPRHAADRPRRDGALLGEGLPVDERGRPAPAGRRAQRQPVPLLSRASRTCCSPCSTCICSGIDEMLLDPVWKDVPDPIDRVFALLAKYRELIVHDRLHLRLSDRQPGARAARARSAGARAARGQFLGLDGRRSTVACARPARACRRTSTGGARHVRPDDDGRRRDARAHLSRRGAVRRRRRRAARVLRSPARRGGRAGAHASAGAGVKTTAAPNHDHQDVITKGA